MESLYSEEQSDSPSPDEKEKDEKPEVEGHTELVSKKLLGGKDFKPGEEVVLKVVRDYGDEIEVSYAPEKPKGKGMSEDEELDALSA